MLNALINCRCVDAEAYEVNKDDLSNGIFISYLKKRLMEDEKVTVMLDRVAEGKISYLHDDIALIGKQMFILIMKQRRQT